MSDETEYEREVEEIDELKRWFEEEKLAGVVSYHFSSGDEGNITVYCDECGEEIKPTADCWCITMDSGTDFFHCLQCSPKED